jgi:hypothetical protein
LFQGVFEDLDDKQANLVLGAMKAIAASGSGSLREIDRRAIETCGPLGLVRGPFEVATLNECPAGDLASAIPKPEDREQIVRVLAVMSLAGGVLEPLKNDRLLEYASQLEVDEEYLTILEDASSGRLGRATDLLAQRGAESFVSDESIDNGEDPVASLMPYDDGEELPEVEARFRQLGELPEGTFGRAFYDHFVGNEIPFPAGENGQIEGFVIPHDSAHVLSGYSTSEAGELLTATFIAGMDERKPMESQILPALFSWHLGISLTWLVGSVRGSFEPEKFWTAWSRGQASRVNLFDSDWDFWATASTPLADFREDAGVPPLDPSMHA